MRRWSIVSRGVAIALAAVLTAGIGGSLPARAKDATVTPKAVSNIEWKIVDNKVPVFTYQTPNTINMYVVNGEGKKIENIVITPEIKEGESDKWPFQKDDQDDEQKIKELGNGEKGSVVFKFTEKDNIGSDNHRISFRCTYRIEGDSSDTELVKDFWVRTTAKPEEKKDDTQKIQIIDDRKKDEGTAEKPQEPEEGGVSNGEASYFGGDDGGSGGEGGDGSVPRVIVTGFDTEPKEVKAGTNFVLKVHLKNTSKKTRVKNMLFDLNSPEEGGDEQTTAPAFLPSSGSSSIYLEGMKANGTADIAIKLNAKSDLLQKPYSVELNMKYEDSSGAAVEAASSLSIPVKQDARFEFSDFEITPESISVEDEANVMCNLYNLGRIKLYNVKATFEGSCIEKEEVFVGNVESGATAPIDAMLKGTKSTQGPEPVTMTMSYENEEGEVTSQTKELMLEVSEASEAGMEAGMMPLEEEKSGGFPILPVIIVVGLIVIIASVVIILKARKKRLRKNQEEEFLYELDGSSEDE